MKNELVLERGGAWKSFKRKVEESVWRPCGIDGKDESVEKNILKRCCWRKADREDLKGKM